MQHETEAIVFSGSNLGDRTGNLKKAKKLISEQAGTLLRESSVYQTEPWNLPDEPDFLNQALLIETKLSARELLECLLDIERQLGRTRSGNLTSRVIDLDLIFFGNEVHHEPDLVIPHPRMHLRLFNLLPINEIASQFTHPVLGVPIKELLVACTDKLKVIRYQNE